MKLLLISLIVIFGTATAAFQHRSPRSYTYTPPAIPFQFDEVPKQPEENIKVANGVLSDEVAMDPQQNYFGLPQQQFFGGNNGANFQTGGLPVFAPPGNPNGFGLSQNFVQQPFGGFQTPGFVNPNLVPQNFVPQNLGAQNFVPQNIGSQNFVPQNLGPQNFVPQNLGQQNFVPQNLGFQNFVPQNFGGQNFPQLGIGLEAQNFIPQNFGGQNFPEQNFGGQPQNFVPQNLGQQNLLSQILGGLNLLPQNTAGQNFAAQAFPQQAFSPENNIQTFQPTPPPTVKLPAAQTTPDNSQPDGNFSITPRSAPYVANRSYIDEKR